VKSFAELEAKKEAGKTRLFFTTTRSMMPSSALFWLTAMPVFTEARGPAVRQSMALRRYCSQHEQQHR
jgi:hypothetical protein